MNLAPLLAAVPGATEEAGFGPVTVTVDPGDWAATVTAARDLLGCTFFDFLSAVDDPAGVQVVCHLASVAPFHHVVLRTVLAPGSPAVASVADVFAGAAWHERETAEMFGITFLSAEGEPLALEGLLLPPGFVGHPLRKEFALESRLDRPWPGDGGAHG